MEWLFANGPAILEATVLIIGGFSILATMTKNESDDKIVAAALKIVNALAMNFGRAKNRGP